MKLFFQAQPETSMNFQLLIKSKLMKVKAGQAIKISDVELIMLVNLKMPTKFMFCLTEHKHSFYTFGAILLRNLMCKITSPNFRIKMKQQTLFIWKLYDTLT